MLDENTLWYFGNDDLEAALAMVAYSKKKEDNGRTKDLKDLIMERFGNDKTKFFEWSCSIHKEVRILRMECSIKLKLFRYLKASLHPYNLTQLLSFLKTIKHR